MKGEKFKNQIEINFNTPNNEEEVIRPELKNKVENYANFTELYNKLVANVVEEALTHEILSIENFKYLSELLKIEHDPNSISENSSFLEKLHTPIGYTVLTSNNKNEILFDLQKAKSEELEKNALKIDAEKHEKNLINPSGNPDYEAHDLD